MEYNQYVETKEKIDYWTNIAAYDLETAFAMLSTGRFLYVGFMCHQAIEKILKACFVSIKQTTPPYSHGLSFIAKECGIYSQLSDDQKDILDLLEPLNIKARYPSYADNLNQIIDLPKSHVILAKTSELFQWIKQTLSR